MFNKLYEKIRPYINGEIDHEPLYQYTVIPIIESWFNTEDIKIKTDTYWEGNMEYGCFCVAGIYKDSLFLERFNFGG